MRAMPRGALSVEASQVNWLAAKCRTLDGRLAEVEERTKTEATANSNEDLAAEVAELRSFLETMEDKFEYLIAKQLMAVVPGLFRFEVGAMKDELAAAQAQENAKPLKGPATSFCRHLGQCGCHVRCVGRLEFH